MATVSNYVIILVRYTMIEEEADVEEGDQEDVVLLVGGTKSDIAGVCRLFYTLLVTRKYLF